MDYFLVFTSVFIPSFRFPHDRKWRFNAGLVLHNWKSTACSREVHPIVTKRLWRFQRTVSIKAIDQKPIPITREMGIQPPSGGIDVPRLDKPTIYLWSEVPCPSLPQQVRYRGRDATLQGWGRMDQLRPQWAYHRTWTALTGLSKATVFKSSATVWGHTNSPGRGSQDPRLGINFRARNHRQILTKTHHLEPRQRTFESTFFEALNSHSHAGASRRPPAPPELTLTNPNR